MSRSVHAAPRPDPADRLSRTPKGRRWLRHSPIGAVSALLISATLSSCASTVDLSELIGLVLDPAEINLHVEPGVAVTATLQARALYADGSETDVTHDARWDTSTPHLVTLDGPGEVSPRGSAPGTAEITAGYRGFSAEARVHIAIAVREVRGEIDPEDIARFDAAAEGAEASAPLWEYPEDQTVYPSGMLPPLFQWEHNGNSIFRLLFQTPEGLEVAVYTRDNAYQPSTTLWDLLAATPGSPIDLSLSGLVEADEAPTRQTAVTQTLYTADAALDGAVYYWQIETGDIMQIDGDHDTPDPVFSDNAESGSCRGCHAITRDGGRIGFMYNGGDDPRAGLAWASDPEPPIVANHSEHSWTFVTFDPSGHRAVASTHGDLWLADVSPELPEGIGRLDELHDADDGATHAGTTPAWSPDGSLVAYIRRPIPDQADWNFFEGDLMVMAWHPDFETLSPPVSLVEGGEPDGHTDTLTYPTWSPDSRWLAIGQGPDNRGTPPAELHLVDPRSGQTTRLSRGAPDGLDVFPNFSPFIEGGYYWLLFYSQRPYGHITDEKQLWVMAIDVDAQPGEDPSHPAFWLPGQDPEQINITGVWSRATCSVGGQWCKSAEDCCAGFVCEHGEGEDDATCQQSDCTLMGRTCSSDAECCPGHSCRESITGMTVCQEEFAD